MLKTLKIFLMVLGLGIFILPKQMIFAQNKMECSDHQTSKKECCESSCHPEKSDKSEKNNCGNDCSSCNTCSVNFVLNYISPEIYSPLNKNLFAKSNRFNYKISFFPSTIQNIWQPPKLI